MLSEIFFQNMTTAEKIQRLCALRNHGSKFGIDRMRLLADAVGNPQNDFPIVHIAGTNGKGSTAAMLESILRAHGLRVGLYTSPHLLKLGERVQVNRAPLSDEEICAETDALLAAAARFGKPGDEDFPSFFELMTAAAFRHFSRERCGAAVVETGLGGRLDATNIVVPAVSVVTSVGLDHTEMLGNTLAEIAREKAGIVKPGAPVVVGLMPEEAEREIRAAARKRGAEVFSVREIFRNEKSDTKNFPETNLFGACQRGNAAAALTAAKIFFEASRGAPAGKKSSWRTGGSSSSTSRTTRKARRRSRRRWKRSSARRARARRSSRAFSARSGRGRCWKFSRNTPRRCISCARSRSAPVPSTSCAAAFPPTSAGASPKRASKRCSRARERARWKRRAAKRSSPRVPAISQGKSSRRSKERRPTRRCRTKFF